MSEKAAHVISWIGTLWTPHPKAMAMPSHDESQAHVFQRLMMSAQGGNLT